ncbi:30S ribosomal protein S18 [bacterium]|nr:30S ribosomal protein S18 [Chloroflexi bacterium CFX6]RIL08790.1 MAG: 30S ribosomal protein S18 [bacterium]
MNARRPRGRFQEGPAISDENPIDYKNIDLLLRFTDTGGRIRSRRRTRTNARNQRAITVAIKRARHLALLPFTGDHVRLYGADD